MSTRPSVKAKIVAGIGNNCPFFKGDEMKPRTGLLSIAALLLLLACSTTAYTPSSQEMNSALVDLTGQDGRACFRVHDISGFGALNDTTLSVSDRFRGHYLLVTHHRCPTMETSHRAAFKGAFTEFCGRRDSVYSGGERCMVRSVFEFENRQAALDVFGQAEARIKTQRESQKDTGA